MLLPYFEALEAGPIGDAIRTSTWLFPFIEAFHLVGLALIGGAVLLVDIGGLLFMIASGVLLFLAESIKCYYSFAFWTKMTALTLAVLFTFTIRRSVTNDAVADALRMRIVGAVSILLWSTVGWGGRWIGFS